MRNFTIYFTLLLCFMASKMLGQETFEKRANEIASKIENITQEEKATLKTEVEALNVALENGKITKEEAEAKKQKLAETRAKNIENRVAVEQENLKNLVQEKVDGKIAEEYKPNSFEFVFSKSSGKNKEKYQKRCDSIANAPEKRTTSQFVFALGLNNLLTNKAVANSDYRYLGSHFYEWGVTANTRVFKNNNLIHVKYGLSMMKNNLRPTDNRFFVESGEQTNLVSSPVRLKDSRFRNVYLVVPIHLEFDFSGTDLKGDKTLFKTHHSFRLGLGGYFGANLKSKQLLFYENFNGNNVKERTKGDFNVNDFIYGVSAYIGYKEVSLYVKYDLSPLFENNTIDKNNISLGVRFDFN